MHDDGTAATAMLGLPGFVLLAVSEHDDELEYAIETVEAVAARPAVCSRGCTIGAARTCGICPRAVGR